MTLVPSVVGSKKISKGTDPKSLLNGNFANRLIRYQLNNGFSFPTQEFPCQRKLRADTKRTLG